jgi:Tfp pilus assembly protein PilF
VATVLNNLGSVLHAQGNPHGARQAFLRALDILERCLPADHHTVRIVQRNLERLGTD